MASHFIPSLPAYRQCQIRRRSARHHAEMLGRLKQTHFASPAAVYNDVEATRVAMAGRIDTRVLSGQQ